jgi:hypothetical protein
MEKMGGRVETILDRENGIRCPTDALPLMDAHTQTLPASPEQ